MSWIDDELKRREALEAREKALRPSGPGELQAIARVDEIGALWGKFEAINTALPAKLQLRRETSRLIDPVPTAPRFTAWLIAPQGAGLGLTFDGIRYNWPEENRVNSHNFWLRWDPKRRYRLTRRAGASWAEPKIMDRAFNEGAVEFIIKSLVTDTRVDYKAIIKRRFLFF